MARVIPKPLAVLLFAAGLAMLAWGGRAFARIEPLPPALEEDAMRICPPTLGEILEIGPVGRKLGYLAAALVGMAVTGVSLLFLIQERERT